MQEQKFRVVAGLMRQGDRVLITERWPSKHMGLTWEFPGGKVEPGESDEQALKRELAEELGIEVRVGSCCFQTTYAHSGREVFLLIYRCQITAGNPTPIDVKSLEWVLLPTLLERPFPPADELFIKELAADRIPDENWEDEPEPAFKPAQIIKRGVA